MKSVEELLNDKGIAFTPSGRDFVINCLNPEHPDNNPSLRIDRLSGIGHCFSCGFKLNIFNHFDVKNNFQLVLIEDLHTKINKILNQSIELQFPKGYRLFTEDYRGISAQTYVKYEAFTHKNFENRIVFPLYNNLGILIAFLGRAIYSDCHPRYDIQPSGVTLPFFPRSINPISGEIILVEGIFDALNLIDKGYLNVVALLGLNTLNEKNIKEKIPIFKLSGVTKIRIFFDSDLPGKKHAELLSNALKKESMLCEILEIPEEDSDPGELTKEELNNILQR
jgi:DNA primase